MPAPAYDDRFTIAAGRPSPPDYAPVWNVYFRTYCIAHFTTHREAVEYAMARSTPDWMDAEGE